MAILCRAGCGGSGIVGTQLAEGLSDRGWRVHLVSAVAPFRSRRNGRPILHSWAASGEPRCAARHSVEHQLARWQIRHSFDLIHAHYLHPFAQSALAMRQAARMGSPRPAAPAVVATLHGTDVTRSASNEVWMDRGRSALRAVDSVTAVSADLARTALESGLVEQGTHLDVVPNFLPGDFQVDIRRRSSAQRGLKAIHISNFRPVKRVPWLIRAFARASAGTDARLVLVGDGPDAPEARAVSRSLGIESRVRWAGKQRDVRHLLASSHLFLLASAEEAFGLAALEAMALGLPVLATDVGGLHELVRHGETGWLTPPDGAAAYAEVLTSLLRNPDRVRRAGRRAARDVRVRYAADRVIPLYENVYRRALRRASSTPTRTAGGALR